MPRKNDPATVFAAGKRGVQTIYNALGDEDPAIQLAAARMAHEAARKLPDAISEELRAAGTARRQMRAAELAP
jgi:hypothetical protein